MCGFKWSDGKGFDGNIGIGQQMSALGVVQASLVQVKGVKVVAPLTNSTGGTSVGDAAAGISKPEVAMMAIKPATLADKVAAGFLTVAVMGGVVGGSVFIIMDR